MIIDPESRELVSHLHQVVEGGMTVLNEQVKAEMHKAVVEVGTNICHDVKKRVRKSSTFAASFLILPKARLPDWCSRSASVFALAGCDYY